LVLTLGMASTNNTHGTLPSARPQASCHCSDTQEVERIPPFRGSLEVTNGPGGHHPPRRGARLTVTLYCGVQLVI
jgi:hypothetical protein